MQENDKELRKLAEEDKSRIDNDLDDLQYEIEEELIPKSDADARNCILEIKQAAGGSESSLFAEDLVNMYKAYSARKGWKWV